MGCMYCQGHAHQVCGRPGCRDESADVEREYAAARVRANLERQALDADIEEATRFGSPRERRIALALRDAMQKGYRP